MQNSQKTLQIVQAAVIAALYVVLTMLAAGFDLAAGAIQCRFSEALTVLPFFTAAAVPGLTIGCLLANFLTGAALPDVIFGTLATFIGAFFTRKLKEHRILCTLPPVISNALIVPLILKYAYGLTDMYPYLVLTVGLGEVISCMIFGQILLRALLPIRHRIFGETA